VITSASPEWVLLSAVYHHVLAHSASPKAAEIAILTARKNGQLRWRCTLRELKAQPGLQVAPGEKPPPAPTVITPDYLIPRDTALRHSISGFGPDWERSSAHSRDSDTRSLFQYDGILVNRDDVLALWPAPLPRAPEVATPPPPPTLTSAEKPDGVSPRVWVVARLLEQLEQNRGAFDVGIRPEVLLVDVQRIAPKGMTIGDTTLRGARRFRKDPTKYCQQRKTQKRKTRRRRR
jgi:hypothetical protein